MNKYFFHIAKHKHIERDESIKCMKFVTSHEYTHRHIPIRCLYSVYSHCHNQNMYLHLLICIFNKWLTIVEGNLQLIHFGNILPQLSLPLLLLTFGHCHCHQCHICQYYCCCLLTQCAAIRIHPNSANTAQGVICLHCLICFNEQVNL